MQEGLQYGAKHFQIHVRFELGYEARTPASVGPTPFTPGLELEEN